MLFRYKTHQFIVAMMLERGGIPHTSVDHGRLFRTRVGRDVRSYLRVVLQGEVASPRDFATVLTRPNRSLSRAIVNRVTDWTQFANAPDMDGLEAWQAERLQNAVTIVLEVQGRLPALSDSGAAVVSALADESGLREFYQSRQHSRPAPGATGDDVLLEVILAVAAGLGSANELLAHIDRVVGAEGDGDSVQEERPTKAVVLSTIHSTKGNEYANVVYFNLNEQKHASPAEVEEERRVTYVGVTRAIDSILVTAPEDGYSPFVEELALNPAFGSLSTRRLTVQIWWNRCRRRWRCRDLEVSLTEGRLAPDTALIEEMEAEKRFRRAMRRSGGLPRHPPTDLSPDVHQLANPARSD